MKVEIFTLTLLPMEAFRIKRGYEGEGYIVNMMQCHSDFFSGPGKYKYEFRMHKADDVEQEARTNNDIICASFG